MLSFIIPTHNFVCTALVQAVVAQAEALRQESAGAFDFEVIVADDASDDTSTVAANRLLNQLPRTRLVEHQTNRGRALLCNWLIDHARFRHVVLMDADAAVCTPDFVRRYWQVRHDAAVVCGSLRNPEGPAPKGCELRFRYEQQAMRHRQALLRGAAEPCLHLSTFNLLIDKEALGDLRFDLRCKAYGYEDALLGLELKRRGLVVKHIDNPLVHTGIDRNEAFLHKTETALQTLTGLNGLMQREAGPSRTLHRLQRWHLHHVAAGLFRLTAPLLRHNLLGRHPNLLVFKLYKLGYYATLCLTQTGSAQGDR